ncbi:hypothetical protein ACFU96_18945 [Streptomyces sp. NPDC057620]|uniref:hypothetical protein n=1 Tax=Streptomyces sp. NPDC057620 TaxID=3346185 RepID=UPI003692AB63
MTNESSSDTIKHLEFIQSVITRLNSTAFLVKGWAMTLAAGTVGLAASQDDLRICGAGIVPVASFWMLDAYYLRQERMYRRLYDNVRLNSESVERFSMDTSMYRTTTSFKEAAASPLLLLFYAASLATLLALTVIPLAT